MKSLDAKARAPSLDVETTRSKMGKSNPRLRPTLTCSKPDSPYDFAKGKSKEPEGLKYLVVATQGPCRLSQTFTYQLPRVTSFSLQDEEVR